MDIEIIRRRNEEFRLIQQLINQKRYDIAIERASDLLEVNYQTGPYHSLLAFCYSYTDMDKSLALAKNGLEISPNDHYCLFIMSLVQLKRDNKSEALNLIDKAIEVRPQNTDYIFHKASILYQYSRFDDVIKFCKEALEVDPLHANSRSLLGIAYKATDSNLAAELVFKNKLSDSPESTVDHLNMSNILISKGEFKKAMEHIDVALQKRPDSATLIAAKLVVTKSQFKIYQPIISHPFLLNFELKPRSGFLDILLFIVSLPPFLTLFVPVFFPAIFCSRFIDLILNCVVLLKRNGRNLFSLPQLIATGIFVVFIIIALVLFGTGMLLENSFLLELSLLFFLFYFPFSTSILKKKRSSKVILLSIAGILFMFNLYYHFIQADYHQLIMIILVFEFPFVLAIFADRPKISYL